jgi:hypothetical protein
MSVFQQLIDGTAPDNLSVGGHLYLRGTAITSLPDNLSVGGSLDLSCTAITSLPDNLSVGGHLDLSYTAITSLPDNLSVGGSLYLSGTAITSLPDNLSVGGSLYLRGTAITSNNGWFIGPANTAHIGVARFDNGELIYRFGCFKGNHSAAIDRANGRNDYLAAIAAIKAQAAQVAI